MNRQTKTRKQNDSRNNSNTAVRSLERTLRMASVRVNGSRDPPPILTDVAVTKTVQLRANFDGTTSSYNLTYSGVAAALPTCFDSLRIIKISCWLAVPPTSPDTAIKCLVSEDDATFVDSGTYGQSRPQLHISPPFSVRQRWNVSTASDIVAVITIEPGLATSESASAVIHVTAEFRSS